jgi:NhaP-type Na+/H+ or K+/H+ antiporter
MARNVGPEDRIVRIVVALALALIIYFAPLTGIAAIVAGVVAAVLLVTGLLARCPAYKLVDIDTSVQEQPYSTTDERAGL